MQQGGVEGGGAAGRGVTWRLWLSVVSVVGCAVWAGIQLVVCLDGGIVLILATLVDACDDRIHS